MNKPIHSLETESMNESIDRDLIRLSNSLELINELFPALDPRSTNQAAAAIVSALFKKTD